MNNLVPKGMTHEQWNTITEDLHNHPSTMNDYRKVLNLLHSYDGGKFSIFTLTKADAQEYFASLDASALSSSTLHRYKATLRALGKRVQDHQEIAPGYKNPFAGSFKDDVRKRTVFTPSIFPTKQEVMALIKILPSLEEKERLMITLMLNLG